MVYVVWLFIFIKEDVTLGPIENGFTLEGKNKVRILLWGNIPFHGNSVCILLISSELHGTF